MIKTKFKQSKKFKPIKYEMTRRKETWAAISRQIQKKLSVPPEHQQSVVQDLVSKKCYFCLAKILKLPEIESPYSSVSDLPESSIDTIIPFIPFDDTPVNYDVKESLKSRQSSQSLDVSEYSVSPDESLAPSVVSKKSIFTFESKTEETPSSSRPTEDNVLSDIVEVEKKTALDLEARKKHQAILKFLNSSEEEAATWRKKEKKDITTDVTKLTLEEQGDFLINKITADFCDWMKQLGGNEKSFISEDIVKELFQIGMDNQASRSICMKIEERKVLFYKLAQFLRAPDKSFHEVLSKHLNWDAEIEKLPSKVIAFGENLPKNLRFIRPENNTAETWLEWNKLSDEQLSFADVYRDIKDLRSTKEYCKWMLDHPEHKKPQYLVDQLMFENIILDQSPRFTLLDDDWEQSS